MNFLTNISKINGLGKRNVIIMVLLLILFCSIDDHLRIKTKNINLMENGEKSAGNSIKIFGVSHTRARTTLQQLICRSYTIYMNDLSCRTHARMKKKEEMDRTRESERAIKM